jgi:hypothetical protein
VFCLDVASCAFLANNIVQLQSAHTLQYAISPNYFFAGRNTVQVDMLSSYHIREPDSYIIEWLEMADRPKYFVCDGDCFSDI